MAAKRKRGPGRPVEMPAEAEAPEGIARPERKDEPEGPKAPEPDTEWAEEPQFGDQFVNPQFEGSFKEEGRRVAVFDLTEPEAVNRMNELLSGTSPREAPRIVVYEIEKQVVGDRWLAAVFHSKILYKRIVHKDITITKS